MADLTNHTHRCTLIQGKLVKIARSLRLSGMPAQWGVAWRSGKMLFQKADAKVGSHRKDDLVFITPVYRIGIIGLSRNKKHSAMEQYSQRDGALFA